MFRRGTIMVRMLVGADGKPEVPGEKESNPSPPEKREEETKQIPEAKAEKKKFKVVPVFEDLVEKEAFYTKYDLNVQLEIGSFGPPMRQVPVGEQQQERKVQKKTKEPSEAKEAEIEAK